MRLFGRKNGFSLVELIVVISVIAVLASIVVGLGKRVKELGNIKLTQSTIDIMSTAVELYYQNNRDQNNSNTMTHKSRGWLSRRHQTSSLRRDCNSVATTLASVCFRTSSPFQLRIISETLGTDIVHRLAK